MDIVSQIIGGQHADILVRQKAGEPLELGELLVADAGSDKIILQVFDLVYGSQMQPEALEWASGLNLENVSSEGFLDANLRNYVLAKIKAVAHVKNGIAKTPKSLPPFFSGLRRIQDDDLDFLQNPQRPLFVGNVRSGSRVLNKEVWLDGADVLPYHMLIAANTGKGKSNALYTTLYRMLDSDYAGILILDPHNEYYQKLKVHPQAERLKSYSPNPDRGAVLMRINYKSVKPWHFKGIVPFSEAQSETLWFYYKKFKNFWLEKVLSDERDEQINDWYEKGRLKEGTLSVIQRRLDLALDKTTFSAEGGQNTVADICDALDAGHKVVIDTSRLASETELMIGSILANEIFERAKREKSGKLKSIVIEEAPRVLREGESNVFSGIAREGRKFGVGLIAITQLASMIPREVLANMNTKIILGNEMSQERDALIGSAAQDLTDDSKAIAGLDKGEAIISSVYTKLAIPVQFPKFETMAAADQKTPMAAKRFA